MPQSADRVYRDKESPRSAINGTQMHAGIKNNKYEKEKNSASKTRRIQPGSVFRDKVTTKQHCAARPGAEPVRNPGSKREEISEEPVRIYHKQHIGEGCLSSHMSISFKTLPSARKMNWRVRREACSWWKTMKKEGAIQESFLLDVLYLARSSEFCCWRMPEETSEPLRG